MAPYLGLLAVALAGAGWAQLAVGLRPLQVFGAQIAALRTGRIVRIAGNWPREVEPVAAELNALLAAREEDIVRARARAGDLAHGLKTPLQALMGEAGRLRSRGENVAADGIEQVAAAMRAHVERELIRARTAKQVRMAAADVADVAARIVAVLRKTPEGERLDWRVSVPANAIAVIEVEDLVEVMGALAENAARHANLCVKISAEMETEEVRIAVCDDGDGIPTEKLDALMLRGARLDESHQGTGLGLAIAAEIANAHRGSLRLLNASPGLVAEVRLPRAKSNISQA